MTSAQDVLRIAAGEVGYDRHADPEKGTKYGRWYEQSVDCRTGNYDFAANGVPYCAMFVSWVLDQAGATCKGFPGAYCPSIHMHQHLAASQLEPGDVLLFDWEQDGTDDHVGLVESNDRAARVVHTIEGNTSGGKVLRRTRAYGTICGGIRPNYNGTAPVPIPAAPPGDDDWVSRLQAECNAQGFSAQEVDGVPGPNTLAGCPCLGRKSKGGITRLAQERLISLGFSCGSAGADGENGPDTQAAIKAFQAANGLDADGIVGQNTWRKLLGL